MTGRLTRAEAGAVFGVLFGCCLAFFLLGVYAGRAFFVPAAPEPAATLETSPAPQPQDLDFLADTDAPDLPRPTVTESDSPVGEDAPDARPEAAKPADAAVDAAGGPSAPPPASAARGPWTVQVGAFDTPEEARQVILRLEAKGYAARLVGPEEGGGSFHRVWVGEFRDEPAARRFEERLKSDGFPTYAKKTVGPGRPD